MSQPPQQNEIADFSAPSGITSSESGQDEVATASTATSDDGTHSVVTFDGNYFDSFAMNSLQMTASAILAAQLAEQASGGASTRDDRSHSIVSASESDTSEAKGKPTTKKSEALVGDEKPHVERHKWTQDETQALVDGCNKHGIGNWKAILSDEQLSAHFEGRTPGDLKDRFRTYFPDAYHEMYPNAKTHNSRAIRSRAPDGSSIFEKGKTKERRPFTHAEDEVLKRGYEKFGSHWAIIAKEPVFEGKRKSTDLRDRFRNAFPSLYEQAGYKPRTKAHKREQRHSGSGSFTQTEPGHAQSASEPRCSFSSSTRLERPNLGWRSDTSISASSQAVSEHSEEEAQSETWSWPHGESLEHVSMQEAATSLMSRSKSFEASSLQTNATREHADNATLQSNAGTTRTAAVSPLGHTLTSAAKNGLRRTQSSKRSSSKIVNQEHAAKSASIKSNKEALLASHQHSHQQHLQQHRHQQKQQYVEMNVQGDSWRRAASESQLPLDFTQMDLDPTDVGVQARDAVAQLDGSTSTEAPDSFQTADTSLAKSATLDAFPSDENPGSVAASNAYLADLYRELGYGGQREAPAPRTFTVDSFQDLLDPLAPQQSSGARWAGSIPLQVPPYEIGSLQQPSAGTNRNHEHHHWAGDLLHRGGTAPFGEWPPVQMGTTFSDYAADVRQVGSQQAVQTSNVPRRAPSAIAPQNQHRSVSDYTSGIGFSEISNRPARRLSNPPRLVGNMNVTSNLQVQNAVQQQQSIPFSMDDLFLLSSSVSAYAPGMPPFLSEVSSGNGVTFDAGATTDVEDVLRRRRSTDTLRGNGNEFMRTFDAEANNVVAANAAMEESSLPGSANDAQNDGERMRALLAAFSAANNDEADLPSRAASLGNLDLAVGRDQAFYAESLPDLTSSAFAGERSSSASETLFPPSQQQQLPISFDDLDLPSFLNRSPAMAPLISAGQSSGATFGNPKASSTATDLGWPSRSGALRAAGDTSGTRSGTSINVRDSLPNAFFQPFTSAAFSSALNDAGTLDRLEHLYLEGLHTPASPSVSFTQPQSSSAGITPFMQQSHRFPAGSTLPQMTTSNSFPLQDSGARLTQSAEGGNGYESA